MLTARVHWTAAYTQLPPQSACWFDGIGISNADGTNAIFVAQVSFDTPWFADGTTMTTAVKHAGDDPAVRLVCKGSYGDGIAASTQLNATAVTLHVQ